MTDREPSPVQLPDLATLAYDKLLRTQHRAAIRTRNNARNTQHHAELLYQHASRAADNAERTVNELQSLMEQERSIDYHQGWRDAGAQVQQVRETLGVDQ